MIAYVDPGTAGLIAQFAAAGFAGVFLYFRSRFGKKTKPQAPAPTRDESAEERS